MDLKYIFFLLQFTVTPVKVDIVSDKPAPKNRPQALDLLDVETETTETLTQSSITELLSSKFRVSTRNILVSNRGKVRNAFIFENILYFSIYIFKYNVMLYLLHFGNIIGIKYLLFIT